MKLIVRISSLRSCLPKMAADAAVFALAYYLAFQARLEVIEPRYYRALLFTLPLVILMKLAVFHFMGSYRSIWRYSSLRDLQELAGGSFLSFVGVVGIAFLLPAELALPRSVPFIDMALTLLLTGAARMTVRVVNEPSASKLGSKPLFRRLFRLSPAKYAKRALVVGAGDAGEMIVREMLRRPRMEYDPVAFVDDDPSKGGKSIHGLPVLGNRKNIPELVERLGIDEIMIAIPSADGKAVSEIVEVCRETDADLKILPDFTRTVNGRVHLSDFRQVEVEDLLGRQPAELDLFMISSYLRGKRILVTGAGGSIGGELCRQILRFAPSEILLFGRGENSIYEIHRELSRNAGFTRLVQVIGDVINKKKLQGVFAMYRPQIVFHAGADKHVPLMEMNPDEAVFNNIIGTKNVLEVANEHRVERVVCISTDKAVNPTSVMGCCKRVAEMLVCSTLHPNIVAAAVRFGNVLGSRGSVIPAFQRQIQQGGPVTVTHKEIRRFFMTVSEAAGLVVQAGAMGRAGEIFVLDMGEPVKIWDLAVNMIRLAGLEPGRDVKIVENGLRPGEKMDEELCAVGETLLPTAHAKIMCVRSNDVDEEALIAGIGDLTQRALKMDFAGIREGLRRLVPEYRPDKDVTDLAAAGGGRQ